MKQLGRWIISGIGIFAMLLISLWTCRIIYQDELKRTVREAEKELVLQQSAEVEKGTEEAEVEAPGKVYYIAIDAGHQAKANTGQEPIGPGATETKNKVAGGTHGNASGLKEYELTLQVALALEEELLARNYKVLQIRTENEVDISNAERAEIANGEKVDAFVRIHANGADSSDANGAMTICPTPQNPYCADIYEDSRRLSDCVLDAYIERTGAKRERVWERDDMSGINWCKVPVTLIELGYMTNKEEDLKMADPEYQRKMAEGIADGIDAYFAGEENGKDE